MDGHAQALIGLLRQHQQSAVYRPVLSRAEPDHMLGEVCGILWRTFGGNLTRATRCLLSRDWVVLDASTIGLFPTLSTPVGHPVVAGVGVAVEGTAGPAAHAELAAMPLAAWAYLVAPGPARLRIFRRTGSRWREERRCTPRECMVIGERHLQEAFNYR